MNPFEAIGNVAGISLADAPWVDVAGGQRRLVHADVDSGVWALGVRYEPGSGTERHRHTGAVFGFTLAGRWMYTEYQHEYTAGTFVHETAGSSHTLVVPKDNTEVTEVYFVVHGANLILDDSDNVIRINDAASFSARYRDLCLSQHKLIPTFLSR
jgi:2,4'-dihydroxyacetophenone dioxygenase